MTISWNFPVKKLNLKKVLDHLAEESKGETFVVGYHFHKISFENFLSWKRLTWLETIKLPEKSFYTYSDTETFELKKTF